MNDPLFYALIGAAVALLLDYFVYSRMMALLLTAVLLYLMPPDELYYKVTESFRTLDVGAPLERVARKLEESR